MNANRAAMIGAFVAFALFGLCAFVPALPAGAVCFLPAVILSLAAMTGGGVGVLTAIGGSIAIGWAGGRAPDSLPLPVSTSIIAMWISVFLAGWYRSRAVSTARLQARVRQDEREQISERQKEIEFYIARGRALSERAVIRRRLSTAAQELGALLDPGQIQERLVALAHVLFPDGAVALWDRPSASAVATRAFESGQSIAVPGGQGGRTEMAVPIRSARTVIGVLHVTAEWPRSFGTEDLRLLEVLASIATDAIGNGLLLDQVQQNALRDGLTGLLNHRAFQERLEAAVLEATRYRKPLSIILADVDHFKAVNDTHGHPAGDAVLQGIAHVLDRHVRDIDVLARYGGEEFVILLFQTEHSDALAIADRIREDVGEQIFETDGKGLRITASFGVSTFPDDGETAAALLRSSDQSLYAAKRAGRNRVIGRRR